MENKKVHMLNLGCSKNQVDAENILGEFSQKGFQHTDSPEEAEVIIVNTCGFIESAKEESINEVLDIANAKTENQKLVVAGCLSQRYLEDLKGEIPESDLIVGTYKAGEILTGLKLDTLPAQEGNCASGRVFLDPAHHHAYLKISEGCNRKCAFCAIPGIRGKQNSRSIADVVAEAQRLQTEGVKEISLVAQDLTFYGREKNAPGGKLNDLLQALIQDTDLEWIRLMYAYPAFIQDDLLATIRENDRICNYLDMPVQHASDRMLKLMNRGHSRESLEVLLDKIRQQVPEIAMRTTLLTGFPGEEQADFETLLDFVEKQKFDRLGCFTYSPEEGTPAEHLDLNPVDPEEAVKRAEAIMELQSGISLARNESLIGKEVKVIIDSEAEGTEYHFLARTEWDGPEIDNQVQIVDGDATPGEFAKVRIVAASEYDLDAEII